MNMAMFSAIPVAPETTALLPLLSVFRGIKGAGARAD